MNNISDIFNKKYPIFHIALVLLLSLVVGISLAFFSVETLVISIFISFVLFAIASRKLYDLLLWACLLVPLFSQFRVSAFEMLRFGLLVLVILVSVYIIKFKKVEFNHISVGIILLSLYAMVTSFQSYYPIVALLKGISLLLLGGFLLFVPLAIRQLYPDVHMREHILRLFLYFSILIVVSSGLYYFINPASSNDYFSGTSFLNERYRGWFVNPNGLAMPLGVFFVPILWFEAGRTRMGWAKIGLLVVFVLAAIELFATQSRAGIVAGMVSLFVLVLGGKRWSSRILIVILIVLSMVMICLENPENNVLRRFVYRNEVRLEGSGRLSYWAAAWNRFVMKPVFGSGLGVSNTDADADSLAFNARGYTIQKDNSYMAALEELGMFGCTVLVAALLLPLLKACWEQFNAARRLQDKSDLIFVAVVSAGILNAVFESWLLSVGNVFCLSFWIFASLLVARVDWAVSPVEGQLLADLSSRSSKT